MARGEKQAEGVAVEWRCGWSVGRSRRSASSGPYPARVGRSETLIFDFAVFLSSYFTYLPDEFKPVPYRRSTVQNQTPVEHQ